MDPLDVVRKNEAEMIAEYNAREEAKRVAKEAAARFQQEAREQQDIDHAHEVPVLAKQAIEEMVILHQELLQHDETLEHANIHKFKGKPIEVARGLFRRKVTLPAKRIEKVAWLLGSTKDEASTFVYLTYDGTPMMIRYATKPKIGYDEFVLTEDFLATQTFSTVSDILEATREKRNSIQYWIKSAQYNASTVV